MDLKKGVQNQRHFTFISRVKESVAVHKVTAPDGRASMTYPVTGAPPTSPSDQWMLRAEDVLVMDISIGEPGVPVTSHTNTQIEKCPFITFPERGFNSGFN